MRRVIAIGKGWYCRSELAIKVPIAVRGDPQSRRSCTINRSDLHSPSMFPVGDNGFPRVSEANTLHSLWSVANAPYGPIRRLNDTSLTKESNLPAWLEAGLGHSSSAIDLSFSSIEIVSTGADFENSVLLESDWYCHDPPTRFASRKWTSVPRGRQLLDSWSKLAHYGSFRNILAICS
jgi:hypothetical protein